MDTNGDGPRYYAGVGQETAPSMTFASEPVTGVYLGNPGGSTSEYVISKRGTKRLRISDTETTIVGPLIADGFTPTGSISLPDGSASAPSLSFSSDSSSGLFYDTKNEWMGISGGGTAVLGIDGTGLNVTGEGAFTGVVRTSAGRFVAPPKTAFPINPAYSFSGTTTQQQSGFDLLNDITFDRHGLWSFYGTTPIMQQNDSKVDIKVPVTCGTNALSAGAATCSSLQSTGPLSWTSFLSSATGSCMAGSGSSSAPSYAFTALSDSGLSCSTSPSTVTMSVSGIPVMSFNATTNTSNLPFTCGVQPITCGTLSATYVSAGTSGITSSGTMSCGTASMTCGVLNCTSVVSSGAVTQPRYFIRAQLTSNQSCGDGATVAPIFNAYPSVGGTFANWVNTFNTSTFTIPKAGYYLITYNFLWALNTNGYRFAWITLNGGTERIAESVVYPATTSWAWNGNSIGMQLALNDLISFSVNQNSGGSLNLLGTSPELSMITIVRISE